MITSLVSCENDSIGDKHIIPFEINHYDGVVITFHSQEGNNLMDIHEDKLVDGKINASVDADLGIVSQLNYFRRQEKVYGFFSPIIKNYFANPWYLKTDVVEDFPSETAFVSNFEKHIKKDHKVIFNWNENESDTVYITTNTVRKTGWPKGLDMISNYDWNKEGTKYYSIYSDREHHYSEELSAPTFVYKGKELPAKKLGVAPFFENYYYIDIVKELNN